MNPAYKTNSNRAMEYKTIVQQCQAASDQITQIINKANGLMMWTRQTLDEEHLGVSSLDNARQFLSEAGDHFQHAANMFSGGSAYRVGQAVAAEPKDTTYSAPVPEPEKNPEPEAQR